MECVGITPLCPLCVGLDRSPQADNFLGGGVRFPCRCRLLRSLNSDNCQIVGSWLRLSLAGRGLASGTVGGVTGREHFLGKSGTNPLKYG